MSLRRHFANVCACAALASVLAWLGLCALFFLTIVGVISADWINHHA